MYKHETSGYNNGILAKKRREKEAHLMVEQHTEVSDGAHTVQGPTREALMKGYDAEEADALLALEQKMDGRGGETAGDPEAEGVADAVTAAVVYTNGS